MGDLKPIGSEKLTGQEKIDRIIEIARFNEMIPQSINETAKSEYSVSLADGNTYQIVKERQGYIIKKNITESETDYIEPMKNRKYYSSYSQAFKRLNLLAGELNRINENDEGVSLYGEQKKFVLRTPKPEVEAPSQDAPAVPSEPPAVPAPELPEPTDSDTDFSADIETPEGNDELNVDIDATPEEEVTFKTIQKLTGKLTQKIRAYDSKEGMTSEDIKYVINMVLSSLELQKLSEEDKEDILNKFEEDSLDLGGDDKDGTDLTDDSEVEDIQSDMDVAIEGELDELHGIHDLGTKKGIYGSFGGHKWHDEDDAPFIGNFDFDYDEEDFDDFDKLKEKHGDTKWFGKDEQGKHNFDFYKSKFGPFKVRKKVNSIESAIMDSIMGESKVDKVISKYFEVSKKEIIESKEKRKIDVDKMMNQVLKMTETYEQELSAKNFLTENYEAKFIGITNKKNLVFENKGEQVKISPEGNIL